MKAATVSIVIPVFNSVSFLEKCITSVVTQTYTNIRIIIVDDGSTDGSDVLIKKMAKRDNRTTCFSQINSGVSSARNLGISKSTGNWITFVDADDWIDSNHINNLIFAAQTNKCDGVICGYNIRFPDKKIVRAPSEGLFSGVKTVEKMLNPYKFQGFLWNKLFSLNIIRDNSLSFNEEIYYCEDLLFCAMYFKFCKVISTIPSASYNYRQHRQSAIGIKGSNVHWLQRRNTALLAFDRVIQASEEKTIKSLCIARKEIERCEIVRRLIIDNYKCSEVNQIISAIRKGICKVICSKLPLKVKFKYLTTSICPIISSKYWLRRERKYLK